MNPASEKTEVLLISMPFAALFRPSIGLSLLKASLQPLQISARILYLTFGFAERTGTSFYMDMVNEVPALTAQTAEWIFAEALFGSTAPAEQDYIEDVLRQRLPEYQHLYNKNRWVTEAFIENVQKARRIAIPFLEDCLDKVLAHQPAVVGFTSVFQQNVASLALAKRIKQEAPETFVVFGGGNCESVMGAEMIRQFPFLDAVVSGEGDIVFPELIRRVREKGSFDDLQGVYSQAGIDRNPHSNAPMVRDMDALPIPDYDDYIQQLQASRLDRRYQPRILFESARGCWWGERNHCTFCGLNATTMEYRSKSADRALSEMIHLAEKYPGCPVSVVDNILDMKYFKDLIPKLAERNLGLDLLYEVKANLKKEQLRMMRKAGIRTVQPGIESFSNQILEIMRKGVKGLHNIQLLKWCKEFGITPIWNLLWGFPGEPPEEYARMARLIPLLTHLFPPEGAAVLRMDRFSPNFFDAEALGFRKPKPVAAYRYIYPFAEDVLQNLAFYFTAAYKEPRDVASYTRPLWDQTQLWKKVHQTSDLFSVDKGSHLLICDLRPAAPQPLHLLTGLQKDLFVYCDSVRTVAELYQMDPDAETLLQTLLDRGLMIRDGNCYLSLAIAAGEYAPGKAIIERLHSVIRNLEAGILCAA